MGFEQIWTLLLRFLGHLQDPGHWKASKDGKAIGPVTAVAFGETDVRVVLTDGAGALTLEARPGPPDHADVYVDGVKQEGARVVVSVKSQFPFKPLIVVLVFKHVQAGGAIHDYRLDNPR